MHLTQDDTTAHIEDDLRVGEALIREMQHRLEQHRLALRTACGHIDTALAMASKDVKRYVLVSDETKEQGRQVVATLRGQLDTIAKMFE